MINTKRFYLIYSVIGLIVAWVVALVFTEGHIIGIIFKSAAIVPVLASIVVVLFLGNRFDNYFPFNPERRVWSAIVMPVLAFFICAFIGCLLNYLINGEFTNYFVKPFFYLVGIGTPLSALIGIVCYYLFRPRS